MLNARFRSIAQEDWQGWQKPEPRTVVSWSFVFAFVSGSLLWVGMTLGSGSRGFQGLFLLRFYLRLGCTIIPTAYGRYGYE